MTGIDIQILGDKWTAYILSEEEYLKLTCDDATVAGSSAYTDPNHKQIYFSKDELTMEIVQHELTHAFYSYQCLDGLSLDSDSWEEICANFTGQYLEKVYTISRDIWSKVYV